MARRPSSDESGTPAGIAPPESRSVLSATGADDARWMGLALEEAAAAARLGEVPVGAVVVRGSEVIASGHNLTHTRGDPSAHAEMLALRRAAEVVGHWRLLECTLYVTLEPCAMCAGAIVLSRTPRLVFGAYDPKAGMCGSLENLVQDPRLNHRVELVAGVLGEECGRVLRAFFRARRSPPGPGAGGPGTTPPAAR